jgi:hypothetical protein
MNGWLAAFIAVLILGILSLALGLFVLYQQHKENVKKQA